MKIVISHTHEDEPQRVDNEISKPLVNPDDSLLGMPTFDMPENIPTFDNLVYSVEGEKRFWKVSTACFVKTPPEGSVVVNSGGPDDDSVEHMKEMCLKFYGYPLGELATPEEKLEELFKENKDYLMKVTFFSLIGVDIPPEGLKRYEELKNLAASASNSTLVSFLKDK